MTMTEHPPAADPGAPAAGGDGRDAQRLEEVRYVKCVDCGQRVESTQYCAYERCERSAIAPTLAAFACKGSMGFCCRHAERFLP